MNQMWSTMGQFENPFGQHSCIRYQKAEIRERFQKKAFGGLMIKRFRLDEFHAQRKLCFPLPHHPVQVATTAQNNAAVIVTNGISQLLEAAVLADRIHLVQE